MNTPFLAMSAVSAVCIEQRLDTFLRFCTVCAVLTCCTALAALPGAIGGALVLLCTYPVGKSLHSEHVAVRKSRGNLWRNWVSFLHRVAD